MIRFKVYGDPKALKRHRTVQRNGINVQHDPSKSDKADFLIQALMSRPKMPFKEPVQVSLVCAFKRPKSHFGTGKNAGVLKSSAPTWHTSTPDADNVGKFCLDALNSVFWHDDAYVCHLTIMKIYADAPYVSVKISTFDEIELTS